MRRVYLRLYTRVYLRLWEKDGFIHPGIPPSLGEKEENVHHYNLRLWEKRGRMYTAYTSVFGRMRGECAPFIPPSLGECEECAPLIPPSLGDLGENEACLLLFFGENERESCRTDSSSLLLTR